jgi:hypothetical protein
MKNVWWVRGAGIGATTSAPSFTFSPDGTRIARFSGKPRC